MKTMWFVVSLLFLTVIESSVSEDLLMNETAFVYVRKSDSYTRSIKFTESLLQWSEKNGTMDFFDKINDKFLDDQAETFLNMTSFKDIERYIGCGLETFRKLIIGFEKINSELENRTGQLNESISMHDTSFSLPIGNSTILFEYSNVVLIPFANSSVCDSEFVGVDNENTTVSNVETAAKYSSFSIIIIFCVPFYSVFFIS